MSTDTLNGKPTKWILPRESNGGIPVNVQDQTTQPVDAYFARALSNFTLSADTGASGETTFVYVFNATAGHGIIAGDEIGLFDDPANRFFFATVVNVAVNVITVDRPIDHNFTAAITQGRIITTEMAVNGSVTPVIYTVNAGAIPIDITRTIIQMLDATAMDDGTFGGLPALTRGLVFRHYNGWQKTVFCFKTNGEIRQFCYDVSYADKAPAGQYGLGARITFGGADKHGVVLRVQDNDVLQWVVQDDLTGLVSLKIAAEGHYTLDE
jgi:hypothetical protein